MDLAVTNEQKDLLKKIAAFPIEAQNILKKDDDVIYAFNDWRLTVGDVKHARTMLEGAVQETPEQDEVARLKGEIEDLNSSFESWFDLAEKTAEEVGPVLINGLKAYLRTSRSGGMSAKLSNQIEAVLTDYCRLYVGNHLAPVLRGLARAASGGDSDRHEPERLLLLQARYVLRNLDKERPGCAYAKLADACERVALARVSADAEASVRAPQTGISDDLVQRSKEILEWRRTGLLHGGEGGALRAYAKRLEDGGLSDVYALDVAQNETNKEAMCELIRLAEAPQPTNGANGAKLPLVMWWNGKEGPATNLADSLENYATVKPGADRDKWAMRAAASWIRKVVPAFEALAAVSQRSAEEGVSFYLIVGVDEFGEANWDICLKLEDAAVRRAESDVGKFRPNKAYYVQVGRDVLFNEIDQHELDEAMPATPEAPAP